MIRYSVQCSHDHVFEEWFSNSADYDVKAANSQIACPECGDRDVRKALMAPSIGKPAPEPRACPAGGSGGCGGCAMANGF